MEDVHGIGGTPKIMKYLLEKGFLHGDCMTVTGKTLAENLADVEAMEFEEASQLLRRSLNKISDIAFFSMSFFHDIQQVSQRNQEVSKNLYIYQRGEYDEGLHTYSQAIRLDSLDSLR